MAADSPAPSFHFTYEPSTAADLQQGDLLARTPDLTAMLQAIHPHYQKDDYTHFLVLTQSCDLVRRAGQPCKAPYITVAAVRPLRLVLERTLAVYQDATERQASVCAEENKERVLRVLEQILNNNHPEYFYLEPETSVALHEPSCAFLRLAIAFRGVEHYAKLVAARRMTLTEVFKAKLGWLVGNIYSRVGTDDWAPDHVTPEDFRTKMSTMLEELVVWYDSQRLREAKRTLPPGTDGREAIRAHIQTIQVPKKKDRVVDGVVRVLSQLRELRVLEDPAVMRRVKITLTNDPELSRELRG